MEFPALLVHSRSLLPPGQNPGRGRLIYLGKRGGLLPGLSRSLAAESLVIPATSLEDRSSEVCVRRSGIGVDAEAELLPIWNQDRECTASGCRRAPPAWSSELHLSTE